MSNHRRKRPWLAALLAVVVSGLGHAYLRRWGRALGWYIAITATVVLVVPDAAVEAMLAMQAPPILDVAPILLVVGISVADAYRLAVRHNRMAAEPTADGQTDDGSTADDPTDDCPHCGRDVDPDLDFCHWCTERLPEA